MAFHTLKFGSEHVELHERSLVLRVGAHHIRSSLRLCREEDSSDCQV